MNTKDSSFHLTVELEQHTPIIHFQHDQAGATLRATELKPKLDKYLIEYFEKENINWAPWRIGETEALDYKIKVIPKGNPLINKKVNKKDRKSAPMYFGNMGDEYRPVALLQYNMVTLRFFGLHQNLLKQIDERIRHFIFVSNFGMRKTKGYGSFTVSGKLPKLQNYYHFTIKSKNYKVVLRTIDLFYKSIRGGINGAIEPKTGGFVGNIYMKPMIFWYAKENGVKWEKKEIKEKKFSSRLRSQQSDHEERLKNQNWFQEKVKTQTKNQLTTEYLSNWPLWVQEEKSEIVRDLLGLSTEQTWMKYPGPNGRALIQITDQKGKIDRFPSPIHFKPVQKDNEFQVYFWAKTIPKAYRQAKFYIKVNGETIGTFPMWKNFNLNHFLDEYISAVRLKEAIQHDKYQQETREGNIADLLLDIYSEIEENRSK